MNITPDCEVHWYAKGGYLEADYLASIRPHAEDYPIIPMEYVNSYQLLFRLLELLNEKEESE